MNLLPLPENLPNYNSGTALRNFLEKRGLSVRKQWGQNFLINPGARKTLVDSLDAEAGTSVWEIGSGLGCMTHELLNRGITVTAFEIDPGLCIVLSELFAEKTGFTLIRGDVLKTWKTAEKAPFLLGNLPYTVAALLMGNLIEGSCFFSRIIITVQKEVALRMAAQPGSKDYSSISVLCASAYSMKIIMTLKGHSFYPVPHVDSAVVRFERLPNTSSPPPLFCPLIRALFSSRRKTIANNLLNFLSGSGIMASEAAETALKACGLTGRERAEMLPYTVFLNLAEELEKFVNSGAGSLKE